MTSHGLESFHAPLVWILSRSQAFYRPPQNSLGRRKTLIPEMPLVFLHEPRALLHLDHAVNEFHAASIRVLSAGVMVSSFMFRVLFVAIF